MAAALLLLAGCQGGNEPAAAAPMFNDDHGVISVPDGSPLRERLDVAPVAVDDQLGELELPAAVEADPARVANVLAPLTGRVVSLNVGLGDRVTAGQVVATLASGDLLQAYDDDDKAEDALGWAKKALSRAQGVHDAGGGADKDLEAVQSALNQAQAEASRTQARLQALGAPPAGQPRVLPLPAPQAGVITALSLTAGMQVSDPTATLMTVTNTDQVLVTAYVAEVDLGRVGVGTAVDIALAADPDHPLHAAVTQVSGMLEPDTRRQKVRIRIDNPVGRLLPNMYATVRVPVPASGHVSVPQSALLMNNDAVSVLVEVRPWEFERRQVKIGEETEASAQVLSGLSAGDRVVVKGGVLLDD
jgi:cobalt-zinc-cadmium efflux system membrane fusion protein